MRLVERPPDEEMERLMRKYGRVRRRVVDWDLRHLDEAREEAPSRGEVVLLILDEQDRLAVIGEHGEAGDAPIIPMGRIHPDEGVEEAAHRTAREETGSRIAIEEVAALHRVHIRYRTRKVERWYFIVLAHALVGGEVLARQGKEEVDFLRLPSEMPVWWAQSEWFLWILKDGGLLHPHSFLLGKPDSEGKDPEDTYAA